MGFGPPTHQQPQIAKANTDCSQTYLTQNERYNCGYNRGYLEAQRDWNLHRIPPGSGGNNSCPQAKKHTPEYCNGYEIGYTASWNARLNQGNTAIGNENASTAQQSQNQTQPSATPAPNASTAQQSQMEILRLVINNYLSFKKSEIVFEGYNVIVGDNASGKTNVWRTLNLLRGDSSLRRLEELRINADTILDAHSPTLIAIELLLSDNEAKMLFEILFKRPTSNIKYGALRKVIIILTWAQNILENSIPNKIFLYIAKSIVIENTQNTNGIFYIENMPADLSSLSNISNEQKQISDDTELVTKLKKEHGFHFSQLLQNRNFQRHILNCKDVSRYFSLDGKPFKIPVSNLFVNFNQQNGYLRDIFQYRNYALEARFQLDIWAFIRSLLIRNISLYQYITKDVDDLAHRIFDFEKTAGKRWQYNNVCKGFRKIFPRVKFEVVHAKSSDYDTAEVDRHLLIKIIEGKGRSFNIEDTASGYFETLNLFSEIVSMEDSVLIIDEPALHLHPIKIRLLSRFLGAIRRRQLIIMTHSPFFISRKLFENNQSLIYISKHNKISSIVSKPPSFSMKLSPHLFNPEIFFSKICILVEGPGDELAIKAVDDNLNNVLEENDILIMNVGSKNNIGPYIEMIENYNVPHIIMVDKDYTQKQTNDTIKLPGKLEDIMRTIGWSGRAKKITPERAYQAVTHAMKINRGVVKSTEIGKVFDLALEKLGVNPRQTW